MRRHKLSVVALVLLFCSCQRQVEKPLAGQPTMNELMHRRAEMSRQQSEHEPALIKRAHALTKDEARQLSDKLKQNPQDKDSYWTLVRHYEYKVNLTDLDALRLWYIEHQPEGEVWPGNINPHFDPKAYGRGKLLWLQHVKRSGAPIEVYRRAADFLEGGDKPLAEEILHDGQRAYPGATVWASALGRYFAQVLLGSSEPVTEFNVFRKVSASEAQTPYALGVKAKLAESNDAALLRATVQYLLMWGGPNGIEPARVCAARVAEIAPDSDAARNTKWMMAKF